MMFENASPIGVFSKLNNDMSKATTHYVSKSLLFTLIVESQQMGRASEELGAIFLLISSAVRKTFYPWLEESEFNGSAVLAMLQKLNRIDAKRNTFSYLTQSAKNTGRSLERRRKREAEQRAEYLAEQVETLRYRHRREVDSLQLEGLEECD